MSVTDLDRQPRLKDYLRPDDLNLNGCVALAAEDLTSAAQHAADFPTPGNLEHLASVQKFYRSDMFKVLSCGLEDGETAMHRIIRMALRGRKVRG